MWDRTDRPVRASLHDLGAAEPLPDGALYMGRSSSDRYQPLGWGNPVRVEGTSPEARKRAVAKFRKKLWSPDGRWTRLRLFELSAARCYCHCRLDETCHVDELITAHDLVAPEPGKLFPLPSLDGLSIAEVGLVLKSHVGWWAQSLGLAPWGPWRHSDTERGDESRNLLPFPPLPLASAPEIALATAAMNHDPQVSELLVEAGRKAWEFLVQWGLNWCYSGRKLPKSPPGVSPCLPSSAAEGSGAQVAAIAQLREYIADFVAGPPVPACNWEQEIKHTKLSYQQEELKSPEYVTWRQLEPGLPPIGHVGRFRALDLAEGW